MLLGGAAHGAPTVPWLNQPVQAQASAAPAAAIGAHPCAGADLRVTAGPSGAYRGQATQEIRIANTGSAACHLAGFPGAQLQAPDAAPQAVGASEAAPELANARIDLAPGDEAVMVLGTPGSCEAANGPQRRVSKRVQLALPGGGLKLLDGVHIDTLCGRATVLKFHTVENDATVAARAQRAGATLQQLTGSVSAPDQAVRGGELRYVVTLTNPTATPVSLAACPAYTQSLYADGKASDSTLRLNCAAAGAQIAPKSSVSFEMRAQVPADLAPGELKLSWQLQGGPGAGKIIGLR
jgi:hypothetical protein